MKSPFVLLLALANYIIYHVRSTEKCALTTLLRKVRAIGASPYNPKYRNTQAAALAIYHLSTDPVSRAKGKSSVAAAAYRSGCSLYDERTGLTFDYTHKLGIIHSEIVTPDGQSANRSQLWNAAEKAETYKTARTAREWRAALPAELDKAQQIELVKTFSQELASRYGVAADFAIHEPDRHGDDRNYHAHILVTTRTAQIDHLGNVQLGKKASIELSDKKRREMGLGAAAEEITAVRQLWEQHANKALERAGSVERIDCRSLKDQGIDREPTIKEGYKARKMEREGTISDRSETNRKIKKDNKKREKIKAEIFHLKEYRQKQQAYTNDRMETAIQKLPIKDGQQYLAALRDMRQSNFLAEDPEYKKSLHQLEQQKKEQTQLVEKRQEVQQAIEDYQQQHKIKTKLHKAGIIKDKTLTEQENQLHQANGKIDHARATLKDTTKQHETIVQEALQRTEPNYKQHLEHADRVEKILQDKRLQEARAIGEQERQNSLNRDRIRQKERYNRER